MASISTTEPAGRVAFFSRPYPVFVAVALALVLVDVADGALFLGDIDDRLRELQIARLLQTGGWFDLSLPMIQTPDVYVSPWSRLVDLPYAVLALAFGMVLPADAALRLATIVWPPAMLALFGWFAVTGMAALSGRRARAAAPAVVAGSAVAMCIALWEFAPGRIDHHNVQLVVMAAMLAGIARWDRSGAILAGAGAGLSLVVGLECLPFVVAAFGGMALAFIAGMAGAAVFLAVAGASLLVVLLSAGIVFTGPAALMSVACDAFSAPYLLLAGGAAFILWAVPRLEERMRGPGEKPQAGRVRRGLSLALPAVLLAGAAALLFPSCLTGPYGMIDPVSRSLWLDRVVVEQSALVFFREGRIGMAVLLAALAVLFVFSLPRAYADLRQGQPAFAVVLAAAALSLVLAVLQIRFLRFPAAFVPLFIPVLVHALEDLQRRAGQGRVAAILLLPVVPTALVFVGLAYAVPRAAAISGSTGLDAVDLMAADGCSDADFSALARLSPGRIVAPLGLSATLLGAMLEGLAVAAVPFHRAAPGIRSTMLAFTTQDPAARRGALAPFDYVAVCRIDVPVAASAAPLYARLVAGGTWQGLEPVEMPQQSRLRIYRIDHAALQ